MTNRDIAMEFLTFFCAGDVDGLAAWLADDLLFKGPFYQFNSCREYLDCLKIDPPEECGFRVLSLTESEDSVAVFYEYEKSDMAITVAQLFRIRSQRIVETIVVFDGRGFARSSR